MYHPSARLYTKNVRIESWATGFGGQPGPVVRIGGLGQSFQKLQQQVQAALASTQRPAGQP